MLYRGNMIPFLLHSGYSLPKAVWFSSIAFGSCISSCFLWSRSFSPSLFLSWQWLSSCKSTASVLYPWFYCFILGFMFTYTTLFGVLVSYVYVRTGNLLAAGFVHSLCNFFSIPSFEYNRQSSLLYPKRRSIFSFGLSLVVINAAYVIGVILYIVLFPILLNPQWCKSQFLLILFSVCCESPCKFYTFNYWIQRLTPLKLNPLF